MDTNRRIILIGIDGATFKIITPLINQGRLPNIKKLMDNGVHGSLKSTIPTVSPVAWTSLLTGVSPGKHDIFDFAGKVPGTYKFKVNTAIDRKTRPFWMDLSQQNKRVFVAGVTMTYPPDRVNGYMVSGLGAPTDTDIQSCVYPPDFTKELIEAAGLYKTVPEANMRRLYSSDTEKERFLKGIFSQIDHRVKLFKYMWEKEKFDFSMIFFLDTDGISHYFWKYMDCNHRDYSPGPFSEYIYRVYEKVDSAIGEILNFAGNEVDLMLASDHGFGPLNRVVFLNNWLESKGYLRFTRNRKISFSSLLKSIIGRNVSGTSKEVDWANTIAYFNGTVGNIFINLKGRDPHGTVDGNEYESLCNKLCSELRGLIDPRTGVEIVNAVYTRGELFGATDDGRSPDIVVMFKSGYSVVGEEIALHSIKDTGEIIADSNNWSGNHELDGIFIAYGKSFKKGSHINGANIVDIAPTLLYYFGLSIPGYMDGKLLEEIFDEEFMRDNPAKYSEERIMESDTKVPSVDLDKDAEEEVIERLRNLGYIE